MPVTPYNSRIRSGFSLVELSIVLVILGLLTGGILAGQSLIRAAEVRGITTEYQRYTTAVHTFRDKYFAIPGDMSNAFAFWGSALGCTNAYSNSDPAGCNGNGDGMIIDAVGGTIGERYKAWQHLAQAGLVEGSYSGFQNVERDEGITRLGGGKWRMRWYAKGAHGWVNQTGTQQGNQLALGGSSGSRQLDPSEAWNIDTKIDDGLPGLGRMFAHGTLNPNCIIATMVSGYADALTAQYNLQDKQRTCQFLAMMDNQ